MRLGFEKGLFGPDWKYKAHSNGYIGPDGLFIRRATKSNRGFYALFHKGKFISQHIKLEIAQRKAEELL